jgi:hypothetical protein
MLSACEDSKWHDIRQETPLQSEDRSDPGSDESHQDRPISHHRSPITEEWVGRHGLGEGGSEFLAIRLRSEDDGIFAR